MFRKTRYELLYCFQTLGLGFISDSFPFRSYKSILRYSVYSCGRVHMVVSFFVSFPDTVLLAGLLSFNKKKQQTTRKAGFNKFLLYLLVFKNSRILKLYLLFQPQHFLSVFFIAQFRELFSPQSVQFPDDCFKNVIGLFKLMTIFTLLGFYKHSMIKPLIVSFCRSMYKVTMTIIAIL